MRDGQTDRRGIHYLLKFVVFGSCSLKLLLQLLDGGLICHSLHSNSDKLQMCIVMYSPAECNRKPAYPDTAQPELSHITFISPQCNSKPQSSINLQGKLVPCCSNMSSGHFPLQSYSCNTVRAQLTTTNHMMHASTA